MNWAAWEYQIACGKRKVAWNAAVKKVEGSRVMLFDSRPRSPYFGPSRKGTWCEYSYLYGGAVSGRMGSGKTTAAQIVLKQQAMCRLLRPVQQQMNLYVSHALDAMTYGTLMHGVLEKKRWAMVHDELWLEDFEWHHGPKPHKKIKHRYYERTSRWVLEQDRQGQRSPTLEALIASAPSLNDTSLRGLARSGREPSWRMPGGQSRTRRKSME